MSFRELRSFTETMRALGYPRPISMENFRTPNFPLVADTLYWLVMRYDPNAKIPDDIDTETQRVQFLTTAAQVMATKARIVLKTKNLYAADGRAVKELLKIAKVLHSAVRACQDAMATGEDDETADGEGFTFSMKASDVAATRGLASEVTERGAKLYELLRRDSELRDSRAAALRFLESISSNLHAGEDAKHLERSVQEAIASLKDNIASLERQAAELGEDEQAIEGKIRKKRAELDRNQKRLESLQSVRPAFMDEYERLERELADEYEVYITKFRNLDYLQHELDAFHRKEKESADASARALKKLQKRLKEEESRLVRGDEHDDEADGGGGGRGASPGGRGSSALGGGRPPAATGGPRPSISAAGQRPGAAVGGGRAPSTAGSSGGGSRGSGVGGQLGPASSGGSAGGARVAAAVSTIRGRMNAPVDDDDESSELTDDDEEGDSRAAGGHNGPENDDGDDEEESDADDDADF